MSERRSHDPSSPTFAVTQSTEGTSPRIPSGGPRPDDTARSRNNGNGRQQTAERGIRTEATVQPSPERVEAAGTATEKSHPATASSGPGVEPQHSARPRSVQSPGGPSACGASNTLDRWLAGRLRNAVGQAVCVELWDGWRTGDSEAAELTVRFANRATLWSLLRNRSVAFGEAYARGAIQVRTARPDLPSCLPDGLHRNPLFAGDTQALIRLCELANAASLRKQVGPARPLRRLRRNSLERSRHNVYHHYDIGNEFYRLWLDRNLVYTCAYYHDWEAMTLEDAQIAKMDLVCRKVRLRPGLRVIEAGCGWGGLALYMARHYGVQVRAFNVSREQLAYARERARREGLADRVEFVERDWREIDGTCDAFVSVGMLEHVGPENYVELGRVIRRVLKPDGLALLHSIGRDRPGRLDPWIDRRIFPGAHPPSLREMSAIFEAGNFSILDVENLRLHYARTLEDWLHRFEQHEQRVRAMYDEQFVRTWRLYLCGSIAAFRTGVLQLFQVVFAHRGNHLVPLTRAHILDGFPVGATGPGAARPSGDREAPGAGVDATDQ
ncbi:MAG: methyltransferase domain-containing protein [Planctomycetota bacterium]|nr:MAG: methyltransferase domain-containing protein [Planctomycetota bacterium]